jgi:hypothetical protein
MTRVKDLIQAQLCMAESIENGWAGNAISTRTIGWRSYMHLMKWMIILKLTAFSKTFIKGNPARYKRSWPVELGPVSFPEVIDQIEII